MAVVAGEGRLFAGPAPCPAVTAQADGGEVSGRVKSANDAGWKVMARRGVAGGSASLTSSGLAGVRLVLWPLTTCSVIMTGTSLISSFSP